jgi:hypothetical protein
LTRPLIRLLTLVFLLVLGPAALSQHFRGSLEGTVNDPNGAVVPGAQVTMRNTRTGAEIAASTDDRGGFNFQNLEPGTYVVTVEKQGFRRYEAKEVTVKVGAVTPFSASLEVGEARETVEVVSATSEASVDTSRPTVDGVVTPKQIENLPLNGRTFLDLAQQEPGVQVRDGGDFDPTKNQFVGVSMGGRSGRSTRIQVDGVDITDETVGTTTTNISNETIQEFQVSRSSLDASTDVTSSGAVNIVTRSGSNRALPQKSWTMSGSALPPDVRRWLCPADSSQIIPGLCPWSGLSPSDLLGQRPHQGHSPKCKRHLYGGA